MTALEIFKKRMLNSSGSTIRDENIKNSKILLQSTFYEDPSFNPHITFWESDDKLDCRIFSRKKSSNLVISTIQTLLDSNLVVGSIIFDNNTKEYWLCTNLFNIGEIHKQGELTLCNYTLLFQSPEGVILSYPCVDNSTNTIGTDEDSVLTTLNGVHRVKLPFDENTKLIREARRFFLDKYSTTTYAVTNVNNTTFNYGSKGLIELTLQQDSSYNRDTDKNGVCNYFEPITTPPNPDPPDETANLFANITGNTNLKVGYSRTYLVNFSDNDGAAVADVDFEWNVECNFADKITQTISGNTIKLQVDDDSLIGESFLLCILVDGKNVGEIEITIVEGF
ncbi:hypothetical protein DS742_13970 [Lacrimispora amygdalina]|uniref:Uncharacterized protein n=1 Tax=Lacrimispora amygdalina TaxID=253257 RepID=A0A3E2NBF8_9FIRM|nr:hypothetical protein [Clostridium indicum]RFZ78221.1 hypothetical protein DS742_13970 [Clostridium indicum]